MFHWRVSANSSCLVLGSVLGLEYGVGLAGSNPNSNPYCDFVSDPGPDPDPMLNLCISMSKRYRMRSLTFLASTAFMPLIQVGGGVTLS